MFTDKTVLETHMHNLHQEEIQECWQCDKCDRSFKNEEQLKEHIESQHKSKCRRCDNTFESHGELKEHIWNEHYDDTSGCDVCGVTYTQSDEIIKHYKTCHINQGNVRKVNNGSNMVCKFWLRGNCKFGNKCNHPHSDTSTQGSSENWTQVHRQS